MKKASADRADTKPCAVCGRTITWRKKWERSWPEVRYCSDACRRRAGSQSSKAIDAALEAAILALLDERGRGKTICPSEAARRVASEDVRHRRSVETGSRLWSRPAPPPAVSTQQAACASSRAAIPVDPSHARGPYPSPVGGNFSVRSLRLRAGKML